MRAWIVALILSGMIVAGWWLVRGRHGSVVSPVSQNVAVTPDNTRGISPPVAPLEPVSLQNNSAPSGTPAPKTDNPLSTAPVPPAGLLDESKRTTVPATHPGTTMPLPSNTAPVVSPVPVTASAISSAEVAIDVDKITLSLRDYRTVMGGNPVGTNKEITEALNGGNPKQARLLPEGQAVNENGELVDRWGTPYFFHQLSKSQMEIRSAGPDKKMYTEDDTLGR